MTPNRRIVLNTVAIYGRSLLIIFCGVFTSRWALRGLGVEAFGVYGVIGVVISICAFLNSLLSNAVGRHYAFAVGAGQVAKDKRLALKHCQEWFNVAVLLHIVVATIVAMISYFVGEWAIDNYLAIPRLYIGSAHQVLRFSILGMTIGILSAPFNAMFVAKQNIAEVTVFNLLTPVLNITFAWMLLSYSGDRLVFYAFYMMFISALPSVLIMARALYAFPECKLDVAMMWNAAKIRQIFSFAGWLLVGMSGLTIRMQGVSVLVNKVLGVQFNSTMGIANTVVGHASSLSGALNNAFWPAVTNAAGADEQEKVYSLAFRSTKFSTMLLALFFLPLSMEIGYIVNLWLDVVPPGAEIMCVLIMIASVVERASTGAMIAVNAEGSLKWHEIYCFVIQVATLAVCYALAGPLKLGIAGIGWGLVFGAFLLSVMRMMLWKFQLGWRIGPWLVEFALPFLIVSLGSYSAGRLIVAVISPSFWRLILNSAVMASIFVIGSFLFIFNRHERRIVLERILKWRNFRHG